jgi:hypothetical protein
MEGIRRTFLDPAVIEEAKRRARALIRSRTAKPVQSHALRRQELQVQIENLADAIAQGALRASPMIAEKLRLAEEDLARLAAQAKVPIAHVEQLIPRLVEEIERAMVELPRTLAAGNIDLARQELRATSAPSVSWPSPRGCLLYSERSFVEAVVMRARGTMESIVGSGGRI